MQAVPEINRPVPLQLSRGGRELARRYRQGWKPADRRPIYEWAADNVILPPGGVYGIPGAFDVSHSSHLVDVFHAFQDIHTRQVNVLKAIQTGGSLFFDVSFQWIFGNAPAPTLWAFQSDDDAMEHYTTRIEPTFREGPLASKYETDRKKRRGHFHWPHMELYMVGANANSLQNKSIKYLSLDECWRYAPGLIYEAFGRTEFYKHNCKIVCISQAGEQDSDWHAVSEDALQHDRHALCMNPKCRHLMPLEFFLKMEQDPNEYAGLVFESKRLPSRRRDTDHAAATAAFRCPKCGHRHPDTPQTHDWINETGRYVSKNPDNPGVAKTFRWTSLLGRSFGQQAKHFTAALNERDEGSLDALKKVYQKRAVLHWNDSLGVRRVEIETADYKKANLAASQFDRAFLTSDYQQGSGDDTEHYLYVARGWNADGSSRLIAEGRAETHDNLDEVATKLGIPPACVFKDGGENQSIMAQRAAEHGWKLLIGHTAKSYPWKIRQGRSKPRVVQRPYSRPKMVDPLKGRRGQKRVYVPAFLWSNPTIKDILWKLRHGQGRPWEVPADVSPDYKKQIDSERKDPKTGIWKPHSAKTPNHFWDCECMQVVAAIMDKKLVFETTEDFDQAEPATVATSTPPAEPAPPPEAPSAKPKKAAYQKPPYAQPDQLALF
jgi:hypothetical protein